MAIRVALNHRTFYQYDRPASLGPQVVRLRPAPHCRTPIVSYSMTVTPGGPGEHFINWQQDPQNNRLARLVIPKPTRKFGVEIDLVADLTPINPFDFFLDPDAENYPFRYDDQDWRDLRSYLDNPQFDERTAALYAQIDLQPQRTIDFLVQVNTLVNRTLGYTVRMDPGVWPAERTLEEGIGSCRDFAWLMVQLYRKAGLAARFVSGYSIQLAPDVKPIDPDAPAGVAQDVCDLHAWVEVYLPGAGWVGLDATSGMMCGEGHIPLATSADATGAAPIEGAISPVQTEFDVSMSVTRVHEDPRVTKPYTEAQWAEIVALGDAVDGRLEAGDVRLSMGGEPTFIAAGGEEGADGAEWNTAAVGPTKKPLSLALIKRFRAHFGPRGLLHYGQGKWYPGEPLPRWALGLYWRRDGEPVWENDALIGDETVDYGYAAADAERFLVELCGQLGVDARYVRPAFEEPVRATVRERELPVNVSPGDSKLEDAEERLQLARVAERGLDTPTGYVLPIEHGRESEAEEWYSGAWALRSERLYLVGGTSPAGLRLPLESLPWVKPEEYPYMEPEDPSAQRGALPGRRRRAERRRKAFGRVAAGVAEDGATTQAGGWDEPEAMPWRASEPVAFAGGGEAEEGGRDRTPVEGESAPWVVRTAMAAEAREGRMYVFMPPTRSAAHYLDLVAAVEHAAEALDMPVLVEGYTPPVDPRLEVMKVTPDPGVIEVNVHPATSWRQLVDLTETVYGEARQVGLGTEKFQLDGKHTGTGGGNHIVVGGATPGDSPFLRRPDLLKSLIGYWHNHPSLSYLFSGLFIGPTSQAPRFDEGRPEAAYEMEIAFAQVPRGQGPRGQGQEEQPGLRRSHSAPRPLGPSAPSSGPSAPDPLAPWMTDRIFRHLLTDLTGNTHRAEFCIDKLYSPDSVTGRLGLVEFRGFEMPPHPRMSLTQQLLLRALIARFWEEPYEAPLTRWGTRLHDRFLLPHFVRRDFDVILSELNKARGSFGGFRGFRRDWFASHFEFRFPALGTVTYDGVTIELRHAIEPWLTLGEEGSRTGTARYVDSSLERLQLKVSGLDPARHAVAVNGIEVPLTATGTPGEYVAGVRYRAWQPWSSLHPTIGVHAPLRFDLIDRVNAHAVGGCTYHVTHPGGRSHDQAPVNALEAETRRVERFQPFGHTPGTVHLRQPPPTDESPVTLDLRRVGTSAEGTGDSAE